MNNHNNSDNLPYSDADSDGVDDFTEGESYFDVEKEDVSELSEQQINDYQQIFENDGWDKFKAFLKAENKWGRRAKIVKDIGLFFIPYGKRIENITEATHYIMTDEREKPLDWVRNRLKEKSTWVGVVVAAGGIFGLDLDNEQAELIAKAVVAVGSAVLVIRKELKDW